MGEGKLRNAGKQPESTYHSRSTLDFEADAKFPGQHGTGGAVEPPSPTLENPGQVRSASLISALISNLHFLP